MQTSPLNHTTLAGLVKKLLKSLDEYNANDLTISTPSTDQNTAGEVGALSINLALHAMYDLIKDSKYLKALPSTQFSSTANQDYIDLDINPQIDEIESIMENTNHIRLVRRSWNWYRKNFPDPSQSKGVPYYYIRRDSRIYLAPRPASVINYTIDYVKLMNDLTRPGDISLLPTHYDYWIIDEAKVNWLEMEDPQNVPEIVLEERNDSRETAVNAIMSEYDQSYQVNSHWQENNAPRNRGYQRPVGS